MFSTVAVSLYIPTSSGQGFIFFTLLPTLLIFYFFDNSHPNRSEVIPDCTFDFHFPNDSELRDYFLVYQ